MNGGIFISYRRDDSAGTTGRLYDRIQRDLPNTKIFIDVDSIAPGDNFVKALDNAVSKCDVLIAVIGKNWLDIKDKAGQRRLNSANDFVRIEIQSALKQNIRIIPVLVDNAVMPQPEDLPNDLKELAYVNAIEVSYTRFNADTSRLISSLQKTLDDLDSKAREQALIKNANHALELKGQQAENAKQQQAIKKQKKLQAETERHQNEEAQQRVIKKEQDKINQANPKSELQQSELDLLVKKATEKKKGEGESDRLWLNRVGASLIMGPILSIALSYYFGFENRWLVTISCTFGLFIFLGVCRMIYKNEI